MTAVILKLVLEVVTRIKAGLLGRVRSDSPTAIRVVSATTLLLVLPGSKLLVLELTSLLFRDQVRLGGFFAVTGLIVVLMSVRWALRRVLSPATPATTP